MAYGIRLIKVWVKILPVRLVFIHFFGGGLSVCPLKCCIRLNQCGTVESVQFSLFKWFYIFQAEGVAAPARCRLVPPLYSAPVALWEFDVLLQPHPGEGEEVWARSDGVSSQRGVLQGAGTLWKLHSALGQGVLAREGLWKTKQRPCQRDGLWYDLQLLWLVIL